MERAGKEQVVRELGEVFSESAMVVVVQYRGLNVAQMTDLRNRMREAGASIRVAKNRLARIALEGKPCAGIEEFLSGPTAIAYADEPVGVSKALCEFANAHQKLILVGAAMGEQILDAGRIEALSKLPSLNELRGKIIGTLTAPAAKIARTVAEPGASVARVLAARGREE